MKRILQCCVIPKHRAFTSGAKDLACGPRVQNQKPHPLSRKRERKMGQPRFSCRLLLDLFPLQFDGVFLVAEFAVANGCADSDAHDAEGRHQHDEDRAVDSALSFFRSRFRIGAAHGTALGEGWSGPEREQQAENQARMAKKFHSVISGLPA